MGGGSRGPARGAAVNHTHTHSHSTKRPPPPHPLRASSSVPQGSRMRLNTAVLSPSAGGNQNQRRSHGGGSFTSQGVGAGRENQSPNTSCLDAAGGEEARAGKKKLGPRTVDETDDHGSGYHHDDHGSGYHTHIDTHIPIHTHTHARAYERTRVHTFSHIHMRSCTKRYHPDTHPPPPSIHIRGGGRQCERGAGCSPSG